MRERGGGGQASIEVLALVPVLVLVAFGAVWVATMLADASRAQDEARVGRWRRPVPRARPP